MVEGLVVAYTNWGPF